MENLTEIIAKAKKIYPEFSGRASGRALTYSSGQKVAHWTILYRGETKGKKSYWVCQCDCGEIKEVRGHCLSDGTSTNCGCSRENKPRETIKIGDRFGKLIVLEPSREQTKAHGISYWKCLCDCGNITYASSNGLYQKHFTSCGCRLNRKIDYTGKRFGKLLVIKKSDKINLNGGSLWDCLCDCGQSISVRTGALDNGQISCGCINSKNNELISELLRKNKILYEREYKFEKCKDKQLLPFDFKIYDIKSSKSYVIEYDGEQHFQPIEAWGGEESFKRTHCHDLIKNKFCFDNGIPIIRIPFNTQYNINDLKLETTRFLLTPENENNYYSQNNT